MKTAVSSYSFWQAIDDGRMTMADVIPKAREMGFEGVEIVRRNESDDEMRALARLLRAQSAEYSIPVISYMVSADFLKNGLENEVARLKKEAETAALMGAVRMRHDSTGGTDDKGRRYTVEEALPIVAEGYRRVSEFAAGIGVHTMIENHGYFFQESARVKKLIEAVNHPNFGWCVDIGNFMCADEDSVHAVSIAAPLAAHVHVKDFHYKRSGEYCPKQGWFDTAAGNHLRGAVIGHGCVNVPECLRILRSAGYDGWLVAEFEGIEDCIYALRCDLINIREMLAQ